MKNKTDEELVFEAGRAREIDSASVEMMRRLKNSIEKLDSDSIETMSQLNDSIEKLNKSTKTYSKVLISLTLVLVGIGIVQFSTYFYPPVTLTVKIFRIIGCLFFGAGFYFIALYIFDELPIFIKKLIKK